MPVVKRVDVADRFQPSAVSVMSLTLSVPVVVAVLSVPSSVVEPKLTLLGIVSESPPVVQGDAGWITSACATQLVFELSVSLTLAVTPAATLAYAFDTLIPPLLWSHASVSSPEKLDEADAPEVTFE